MSVRLRTLNWPIYLAALLLIACSAFVGKRLVDGDAIGTDIASILPEQAIEPTLREGLQNLSEQGANRIALLVSSQSSDTYKAAATDLRARLANAKLLTSETARNQTTGRWIFANRNELLCETSSDTFDSAAANAVRKQAMANVYGVGAPVTGDLLRQDPFLLTLHLGKCLIPAPNVPPHSELIFGTLSQSAFRTDTQVRLSGIVKDWRSTWAGKDVSVSRTGAVFYASQSVASAKGEMTYIGGVGLFGVMVLFWLAFGNLRSVFVVVCLIAASFTFGLAVSLAIFGEVHVLALVFSAMLVGVVADYGVHTMGADIGEPATGPKEHRAALFRPMSVSMLTTSTGFVGLLFLGVAIFKQLAVIAIVGVASAWAMILFVYIPAVRAAKTSGAVRYRWRASERIANGVFSRPRSSALLGLALTCLTVLGMFRAQYLDDVREFQPRDAQLMLEEEQLQSVLGQSSAQILLISQGESLEAAKQNEEKVLSTLPRNAIGLATTRFDPSQQRRAANRMVIQDQLIEPYLVEHRASLSIPPTTDSEQVDASIPDWLRELHIETPQRHTLIAQISASAAASLPELADGQILDMSASYSRAFATYRVLATKAVIVAIMVALIFIVVIYRRLAAIAIVVAPAGAMLGGLFIPAALGVPLSFFSMAGAIVLFGVGIDYSAFMWEAGRKREDWTKASVLIGAITTLLSMGLLGLSETFPVHSFGVTVTTGVMCALVYAALPFNLAKRDNTN